MTFTYTHNGGYFNHDDEYVFAKGRSCEYTYEPTTQDVCHALADIIVSLYSKNTAISDTDTLVKIVEEIIYEYDLADKMGEDYYDMLHDWFEYEAEQSF